MYWWKLSSLGVCGILVLRATTVYILVSRMYFWYNVIIIMCSRRISNPCVLYQLYRYSSMSPSQVIQHHLPWSTSASCAVHFSSYQFLYVSLLIIRPKNDVSPFLIVAYHVLFSWVFSRQATLPDHDIRFIRLTNHVFVVSSFFKRVCSHFNVHLCTVGQTPYNMPILSDIQ